MKKELTLKEIQQIELDLLIEFRDICNKLGLRYYLIGGTLLGAIRHQGFIPWDDDIDVAMPRPDYQKLIEVSNEYNINSLSKFLFYGNTHSLYPFGKFVNTKTYIDSKFMNDEFHKHIWMDIFPLDGLPVNLNEVKSIYRKANFYRKILILLTSQHVQGVNILKKTIKYLIKPILKAFIDVEFIYKFDKLAQKYDYRTSQYVGVITWGLYGASERILKTDIGNGCEVIFEGYKFNTFCCWDSYLRNLFGDYMKLPPLNKRISHNFVAYL